MSHLFAMSCQSCLEIEHKKYWIIFENHTNSCVDILPTSVWIEQIVDTVAMCPGRPANQEGGEHLWPLFLCKCAYK